MMETAFIVLGCLALAVVGAWETSRHRHTRTGKLPEDIQ